MNAICEAVLLAYPVVATETAEAERIEMSAWNVSVAPTVFADAEALLVAVIVIVCDLLECVRSVLAIYREAYAIARRQSVVRIEEQKAGASIERKPLLSLLLFRLWFGFGVRLLLLLLSNFKRQAVWSVLVVLFCHFCFSLKHKGSLVGEPVFNCRFAAV